MRSEPGSSARPDWPLAVVVGAGGLGMAVARRLGQSHRLLIADRDPAHLANEVRQLRNCGYDAAGQQCDVMSDDHVDELSRAAADMGETRSLAYVVGLSPSLGDFNSILAVNLVGLVRVVDAFADRMSAQGAALAIASSSAHMGPVPPACLPILDHPLAPDFRDRLELTLGDEATPAHAYTLSKAGLIRFCQRKAEPWGRQGHRILSLSPGLIATPQGAQEYKASPSKLKLFDATPLQREATMLEIADIADFLLSDRAAYITGTDLLVDGGLIAALGTRRFT